MYKPLCSKMMFLLYRNVAKIHHYKKTILEQKYLLCTIKKYNLKK